MTIGLELFDDCCFLLRKHLSLYLIDTKSSRYRLRGGLAVAGQHHDPQPFTMQQIDGLRRSGLDRISHTQQPRRLAVDCREHDGLAVLPQRLSLE